MKMRTIRYVIARVIQAVQGRDTASHYYWA